MKTNEISVLDRGYVRLLDFMGGDHAIACAARVKLEPWRPGTGTGSDDRLIRFMWENKHTSPFEQVMLKFEVKAPIFVFRQWHRHRTWSFNEISGRYEELPCEFYLPAPELVGQQSASNKQGRNIAPVTAAEIELRAEQVTRAEEAMRLSFGIYQELLAGGWPRELARSVLPVATYSRMVCTVNLLNLFRFLTLRDDPHAQYEIRVYAEALRELARQVAPIAVDAWENCR